MKLHPHYSGPRSERFWREIKSVHSNGDYRLWLRLYTMGCRLQNLESKTLKALALADAKKGKR